ncbi:alkene reductase [Prosthecomicrobium hirschii]|uniref:alkene reductase n=1 Tax=Prosthecodimorpha hirschii TaxID=665126 RepID=UPI0011285C1D|nr:alkene reductase [Prosthecomicrobium hirschii]TPQ49682.1 alkene reductase [Prosthecomicrobium hirschii]
MTADALFSPVKFGSIELKNRIVLAPLTRNRAAPGNLPSTLAATYYSQRASGGLVITEATQATEDGQGYPDTPGLYSDAQVAAWKVVTDAVHAAGGKIVVQLWHTGRISHSVFRPDGLPPLAPSAIAPAGAVYLPGWQKADFETPREMSQADIDRVVDGWRAAAANARRAGFDGVEVHAANGYLIDQFLRDGSNKRTDGYGGPIENRVRFLKEAVAAAVAGWGSGDGVGVRLSPHNPYNDMKDSDPATTFTAAAAALKPFGLAYLHVIEPVGTSPALAPAMKAASGLPLIVNGGYGAETGAAAVAAGTIDAIAYGTLFLANPDLPARFAAGAPLNTPNPKTFYGGTEVGYTDYPALAS